MLEIVVLYLLFNVLAGICLSILKLLRGNSNLSATHWLLLVFFPVLGWGKVQFTLAKTSGESLHFPEKWYVYEYMLKLHKFYLLAQLIIPIAVASTVFFTTPTDFVDSGDSLTDVIVGTLFGFGFLAILLIVLFFTLIWIGIQYLILVSIPKSSQRKIEHDIILEKNFSQSEPTTKAQPRKKMVIELLPEIKSYCDVCSADFKTIEKERRKTLEKVSDYISTKLENEEFVNLLFVCTHNSRRSQFGQIWAAVAAAYCGIGNIKTFSAGTEETAFNKRAVQAIQRVGFKVDGTVGTNPRYSIKFSNEVGALDCFSKTIEHSVNPSQGFAAIMTCSDAAENCPVVIGAEYRESLTYEDPKVSDRTPHETTTYDERCKQIATEMLYLFSKVK